MRELIVSDIQLYKNQWHEFDADSSPMAWNFYRKYQAMMPERFPLLAEFDLNEGRLKNSGQRFLARIRKNSEYAKSEKLGPHFKISGDVDFNFNEKHYPKLERILKDEHADREDFVRLEFCKCHHHAIQNFSLMPVTGGLNNFKGRTKYFDRFDVFIWELDQFFQKRPNNALEQFQWGNKEALQKFLNMFDGIYDYCRQIYFIDFKEFVDEVIDSGKNNEPLRHRDSVVRYMELARKYWRVKDMFLRGVEITTEFKTLKVKMFSPRD